MTINRRWDLDYQFVPSECALSQVVISKQRIGSQASDRGLGRVSRLGACKEVQVLAPSGSWKKIWDKKKSPPWVNVFPSISQTNKKLWAPFENKMIDIFL